MDGPWTDEEVADFEEWMRSFEEPSEDPEHDSWLAFMDAEISWGREIPSA